MFKFIQTLLCITLCVSLVGEAKTTKGKPMLVLDEEFTYVLPRNFRTTQDAYREDPEDTSIPTRKGLSELHAATSAQFSEKSLKEALKKIEAPIWVIDLRRESHGFVNGIPISWYKFHNKSNQNMDTQSLMLREQAMVSELKEYDPLTIQRITSKTAGVINESEPFEVSIERLETEQQLSKRLGLEYRRLQVQDRGRPDDAVVDEFIQIVKSLPPNATLYFHCRGGKGRSTTFMVLYDMLKNGKTVSLEDIVLRQQRLGGVNVLKTTTKPGGEWMTQMRIDRKAFVEQFYRYATDPAGYPAKGWQEWLQINNASL